MALSREHTGTGHGLLLIFPNIRYRWAFMREPARIDRKRNTSAYYVSCSTVVLSNPLTTVPSKHSTTPGSGMKESHSHKLVLSLACPLSRDIFPVPQPSPSGSPSIDNVDNPKKHLMRRSPRSPTQFPTPLSIPSKRRYLSPLQTSAT